MPALPWLRGAPVDPDLECVVMASRLPLAHHRHIPGFLRATTQIRRQLANATGLVGYALDAKLLSKTFWTLSAWQSREALEAFTHGNPHIARVNEIRPRMRQTTFVFWTCRAGELPISWAEARRRIEAELSK
jgi:hypothetical protein